VGRGHGLARERFRSRDDLADLRVREQKAEELAAGVTAGTDDPDLDQDLLRATAST
jgi:hypothetical protein